METTNIPEMACLAAGTQVGPWLLVARCGQGSYGAVYRAVRIGREVEGPVALKVALSPEDPRFAREAELLSRVRHPAVPRLHGSGRWRHPSGASYPYVAMQWVAGSTLYEWTDLHVPSSRHVLRWLAQLARALEATHAAGGVHRDVKGGNVLVRRQDGQLFLTDFGAGHYQGASPLTGDALPPGTPAYRPPEAWRPLPPSAPVAQHSPGPADDVFALGVIGYRLVVGRYPPPTYPADEDSFVWHQSRVGPHAPQAFNERCCSELSALILRMLSVRPEARGSARELAEALEDAERRAGPEADRLLWAPVAPWLAQGHAAPEPVPVPVPPAAPVPSPEPVLPLAPSHSWRSWPLALAAVLAFMVWVSPRWSLAPFREEWGRYEVLEPLPQRDGGSVSVADVAVGEPREAVPQFASEERIAWEMPSKPFRGQLRPDAQGRCSRPFEVIINEGCWVSIKMEAEQCKSYGYEHKDGCYWPVMATPRPPVSNSATDGTRP